MVLPVIKLFLLTMPALLQYNKKKGLALSLSKGFTLIETTLATFILSVGVLGVFGVIQMVSSFISGVSSKLEAVYLAQEGIENIRNIRDSNWLKQRSVPATLWDQGITTTGWEQIDKFQRKITISKPQPNKITVSAQVAWTEKGGTSEVAAETELYDWK